MDGQRTKKIVTDPTTGTTTTTEYFYNGSILAGQKTGDDEIVFMYDNNGDVFGFEYNGTPYYYVKNAQNDVYLILDENGYAQVLYQYDAWGKVTDCYDVTDFGLATINPIMYRSYYVDLELGFYMYYLNSRYYIAEWGRFASADAYVQTGQGMLDKNMFAYCMNNPVNMADTSGDLPFFVITAAAGAVGGAIIGGIVAAKNGGNIWAGIGIGAAIGGLAGAGLGAAAGAILGGSATASTAAVISGGKAVLAGASAVATSTVPIVNKTLQKTTTALQTYYPPNNGFSGTAEKVTLNVGTLIQRTGSLYGTYVAPAGTPHQMLSLPPDKIGQATTILQVQQPIQAIGGQVAPWFGQIGGGTQYLLDYPVQQLITEGILKIMVE